MEKHLAPTSRSRMLLTRFLPQTNPRWTFEHDSATELLTEKFTTPEISLQSVFLSPRVLVFAGSSMIVASSLTSYQLPSLADRMNPGGWIIISVKSNDLITRWFHHHQALMTVFTLSMSSDHNHGSDKSTPPKPSQKPPPLQSPSPGSDHPLLGR